MTRAPVSVTASHDCSPSASRPRGAAGRPRDGRRRRRREPGDEGDGGRVRVGPGHAIRTSRGRRPAPRSAAAGPAQAQAQAVAVRLRGRPGLPAPLVAPPMPPSSPNRRTARATRAGPPATRRRSGGRSPSRRAERAARATARRSRYRHVPRLGVPGQPAVPVDRVRDRRAGSTSRPTPSPRNGADHQHRKRPARPARTAGRRSRGGTRTVLNDSVGSRLTISAATTTAHSPDRQRRRPPARPEAAATATAAGPRAARGRARHADEELLGVRRAVARRRAAC